MYTRQPYRESFIRLEERGLTKSAMPSWLPSSGATPCQCPQVQIMGGGGTDSLAEPDTTSHMGRRYFPVTVDACCWHFQYFCPSIERGCGSVKLAGPRSSKKGPGFMIEAAFIYPGDCTGLIFRYLRMAFCSHTHHQCQPSGYAREECTILVKKYLLRPTKNARRQSPRSLSLCAPIFRITYMHVVCGEVKVVDSAFWCV